MVQPCSKEQPYGILRFNFRMFEIENKVIELSRQPGAQQNLE